MKLTTDEYRDFQYSARCEPNLVINKASKLEVTPFANNDTSFDDPGILKIERCKANRAPRSLVNSIGSES